MIENYKKKPYLQLISLILFSIIIFTRFMSTSVQHINSTSFAFTYDYGFISRGFMGSLFEGFCFIFKGMYSPYGLLLFTYIFAIILFALTIGLIAYCFSKIPPNETIYLTYICYFLMAFLVTTYVSVWNLGRLDTYCLILSVIACFIIVSGKNLWICVPCAVIATLIHQGYVFMYVNIILALLLFCAIRNRDGKRKTYLIVFALTFISVSVFFLYFELFSHGGREAYYQTIINNAGYLNMYGEYHGGVIDKEILGISQAEEEKYLMLIAFKTMIVFVILNLPYISMVIYYIVKLCKSSKDKIELYSYLVLALGSLTIVPEYILKCDYGRWTMCVIAYFVITFMVASTIDHKIIDCLRNYLTPKGYITLIISMVYIWYFIPLRDVVVSDNPANIANILIGLY